MRRTLIAVGLGVFIHALAGLTCAQQYHDQPKYSFWDRVRLDWHRNNAYPEPFRYADRQIVRTHWFPYIAKGWQIENTLSDYHFNHQENTLTVAGQQKVRWITTHAPRPHRTIFVSRGPNNDVTESRIDLVQQAVAKALPTGQLPPVVRTNDSPNGASGRYVREIWQQSEAAVQAPVLPEGGG